jgi:hypothetical protein
VEIINEKAVKTKGESRNAGFALSLTNQNFKIPACRQAGKCQMKPNLF